MLRSLRRTLAVRLTVWYAGIFAVSSMLAFLLVYLFFVSIVRERTDDDLEEDILELASIMRTEGLDRVRAEIAVDTQGAAGEEVFYHIWGPDGGQVLDAGVHATGLHRFAGNLEEPVLATIALPGFKHEFRMAEGLLAPGYVLVIGQSLEEDNEFIAAFRNGFLVTLLAVLSLAAPIGWFLARRALRPVRELTRTAAEIAGGALHRRVPAPSGEDELGVLVRTFNTMLDRIQALIVAMREMTDNLAHDLRSPVTRIRTSSEMAMADGDSRKEWESLAANTIEECDRLMNMIDTTLDIAEAESGAARLKVAEVDLASLVLDACDVYRSVAEDREISIETDVRGPCLIQGDLHRLQRVVGNLLDNALKYTPAQGRVTIRLIEEGPQVKLTVQDTGIGISPEELPHIFQRFYRSDRSRSGNGNGLGLSLALAFVRAHGGDITVESKADRGSTFIVSLGRSPHSS